MKKQKGFMALFSVIIITSAFFLTALSLSFSNFFSRFDILDSEFKEKSRFLAEACIEKAILKILQEPNYLSEGECISVGDTCSSGVDVCQIISISNLSQNESALVKKIITKGEAGGTQKAFTYYQTLIQISINGFLLPEIISFEELPNLP